jgi:4-amino-4-deoxy-L-arabinose transferase-like glycosyltransferase
LLWVLIGFAVFAFSATKFHHYAFPIIPPLLLLCAVWLDQVLDEGLRAHAGELFAGGLLYGLVAQNLVMNPKQLTDMFVYNYDRPYPERETDPRQIFTILFFAGPAVALSPWAFDRLSQWWGALRSLFDKKSRAELKAKVAARMAGEPLATVESRQDRTLVVLALVGLALTFSIFLGWFHWRRLSPHWSQRDLFWAYHQDSTPDEPIGAYLMNWRGETFYSRNTVRQLRNQNMLQEFFNGPGKRKWLLVEQARLAGMRQALGPAARVRVVESKHNKFVLTVAEAVQQPAKAPEGALPPPAAPQDFGPKN